MSIEVSFFSTSLGSRSTETALFFSAALPSLQLLSVGFLLRAHIISLISSEIKPFPSYEAPSVLTLCIKMELFSAYKFPNSLAHFSKTLYILVSIIPSTSICSGIN